MDWEYEAIHYLSSINTLKELSIDTLGPLPKDEFVYRYIVLYSILSQNLLFCSDIDIKSTFHWCALEMNRKFLTALENTIGWKLPIHLLKSFIKYLASIMGAYRNSKPF